MKPLVLLCLTLASLSSNIQALTSRTKILMFGDFGMGTDEQRLVADDMVKYCRARSCDFAITTGDNIYPRGVENLYNGSVDYDYGKPNYQVIVDRFVKLYGPMRMPFYMSFGNHDVGNSGIIGIFKDLLTSDRTLKRRTIALMRNQFSFTNHDDNPAVVDSLGSASRLWFFPDEYYHITEKGNISLYAINTNTYPHRALTRTNDSVHPQPENFEQAQWLQLSLKSRPNNWKIVFGHMPIMSRGIYKSVEYAEISNYRQAIIETLCENKVDFIVSGHSHHLEVAQHRCDNGHVLISIITGAAAKRGRIYESAFAPVEQNFLWGNGWHFTGDKSLFREDNFALGFSYLELLDDTRAKLTMKLSQKSSTTQADGCFLIERGKAITKINCD